MERARNHSVADRSKRRGVNKENQQMGIEQSVYNTSVMTSIKRSNRGSPRLNKNEKKPTSICPFTENKLINQVYIKHKVPKIDNVTGIMKPKHKFKKTGKTWKLDRNKISVKPRPNVSALV